MILLTIAVTPYLTQDAFAAPPSFSTAIANDPDDLDTIYSAGDTITITFSAATNATAGNTMNNAAVIGNFTFTNSNIDTNGSITGLWSSASVLVLTVVTAASDPPEITTSVVSADDNSRLGSGEAFPNDGKITGSASLTGDFGLFVAATVFPTGGCSGDCEEPTLGINDDGRRLVDGGFTYNGKSIDVERFFTPYPLVTVQTGKENTAEFKIFDNGGPDNIRHFELAFGLAKGESIGTSKVVINWDKSWDGIETVTLDDPENVLENIKVITSEGSCSDDQLQKCLVVQVVHTFRAPLDFNILGTNVWDTRHNAWQNYYNHGIEIVGESLNPPKEYDGINKGHIYHLTETGKNTAVDEFGDAWTFKYDTWIMDYVLPNKVQDPPTMVMTRTHSDFVKYQNDQADYAITSLLEFCPTCLKSFDDFAPSKSIIYPERINKLNDPEIQKKMAFESERAQKVMNDLLYDHHPHYLKMN